MPLETRFWPYRPTRPPDVVGVYELGRAGHVLYVGAGRIRDRLQCHHRDDKKQFQQYRCVVTNDSRRAQQLERGALLVFKSRHGRLPKYNSEIPYPT